MIDIFKRWFSHSKEQDIDGGQNPWAGLASYEDPETAERKLKFCGRDDDSYDLARLIMGNVFVTLYGKSGIGKTSLLNAGVFPELREEQYTPISLRLGIRDEEHPQNYQTMIIEAIERVVKRTETINVIEEQQDQQYIDYLWNFFARHRFYDKYDELTTPVIVFDQFEEVFRAHRDEAEALLRQLDYLNDKDHTLDSCEVEGLAYHYEQNFRFVASIREDDLYRLEDSIDNCYLPALKRCRYRLRSLSEEGVRDAILVPGEGLFKADEKGLIAEAIISKSRNDDGSISTNIISLLCNRIYIDFKKSRTDYISLSLVENFIKGNPFERFYSEATQGFSNKEKSYIEEHLVDSTSRRNSIPESDFLLHVKNGMRLLVGKNRILQRISTSSDGNNNRVELIHDSFCEPLVGQKEIRKQRKRIRMFAIVTLAVCFIFGGAWCYMIKLQEANGKMKENAIRFAAEKAISLTDHGDSYSARLLALSLLPDNVDQQAYLPEAEAALRYACSHNSAILRGHTAALNGAKYTSDGKRIVTCSYDGTLKIWDAMSGKCLKTYIGHKDFVLEVDFSVNEDRIISYSIDGTVKVWNVRSEKIIKNFDVEVLHEGTDNGFWLSPNKKLLIMCVKGVLGLYDTSSFEQIKTFKETEMWYELCWYPDGEWLLVYTCNHELLRVNVWTNQRIPIAKNNDDATLISMSIDPTGERIAGAFGYQDNRPGYAAVWNVKTGQRVLKLQGEEYWVNGVTFSIDSKRIVTTSMDGPVRIWDASSGACLDILKGHPFASGSPSFSPDGKCIATESADATARIWDAPGTRDSVGLFLVGHNFRSVAYHKGGRQLLVACSDSLCFYDVTKKVWRETLYKQDSIIGADLSPKGNVIALSLTNNRFGLLNMSTKKVRMLKDIKEVPYSISFTPDGQYVAFATGDSLIHVHEVASGKRLQTIRRHNRVYDVRIIDNGRKLVVVEDSTMSVLNIADAASLKTWNIPDNDRYLMQLSPDGNYVLIGIESSLYVWELATGKCVSTLAGHTSLVYACCFSPDGKYVVSTSHDTMVKLWDWRSGVCLQSECFNQYISARFSPDGRHVVVVSRSKKEIRIFDYPPLQELIDQTRERFKNRQLTPEERKKYYLD